MNRNISLESFPLGEKRRDILLTPGGVNIDEITFENLQEGKVSASDCRISKDSLLYQAQIARESGSDHIAANFERAAEMVDIDSKRIIEIYNALRPYRSSEDELLSIVNELRTEFNANKTADFVETALKVMKERKKLKGDR